MSAMMRGNMRMALASVRGAKWRSVLTMLGVIVGIVAVVTVVGIGDGVKHQVAGTIDHYGKDLMIIRPGNVTASSMISQNDSDVLFGMANTTSLTASDVSATQHTPGVSQVAPLGIVSGAPQVDGKSAPGVFVLSTDSDLPAILRQNVEEGDFWNEDSANRNFAVIGQKVAGALFGEPVPLGRTFMFRGQEFTVRGVFSQWTNVPFSPTASFNDAIFIPYQAAAQISHNDAGLYAILAKTGNPKTVPAVTQSLDKRLTAAHGGQKDFTVLGPKDSVTASTQVVHLLSVWIWAVAAISLLIGGVGIMNIMLLSVTERMHEIGVRKAIGATGRQVMAQFLLEATVLSLVGGVIGIAASLACVGLLYAYTNLKPVVSWDALLIATAVSLIIGIIFGTAPAIKAARKDPIQALRHE